jgi:hypothetical protein
VIVSHFSRLNVRATPLFSLLATKSSTMFSKRKEYHVDCCASCSGGWPQLAGSRGSRYFFAAQEDAKNVAPEADGAAE